MKIAWIGTGVMGESMAGHLMDAGHELFVYNRTKSKTDNLVSRGATLLNEVKDAPIFADVVFTIVGYPKDVEEVYLGENGLITTAKKGQVFVDMTTSSPTLTEKISNEFLKVGAYALDLPVTGGDVGARNAGRVLGPRSFLFVLAVDFFKGFLVVILLKILDVDLKIHAHFKKSIEIDRSLYPRTFIPLINSFEFYAYFVEKQAQSHRLQK